MSCPHGNSIGYCDICDEIDAAWKSGEASGRRSVEHCTCPACQITHTNDCAVHNMPAMPSGPCDCGAIPPQPVRSVSEDDVLEAMQSAYAYDTTEQICIDSGSMRAALEHFAAIAQERQS